MPVPSPYLIVLPGEQEAVLMARARSVRSAYRDRLRARIVLAAGRRQEQRCDRRVGGGMHGHSPQVAPPVRCQSAGRAEGRPAKRAPTGVHRRGPGLGRRAGVRAASRVRRAAIEVELPGTGP